MTDTLAESKPYFCYDHPHVARHWIEGPEGRELVCRVCEYVAFQQVQHDVQALKDWRRSLEQPPLAGEV